jgi:type VI secretion system secreted protein VgrG
LNKRDEYAAELERFRSKHQMTYLEMPEIPTSVHNDVIEFEGTRAIGEPTYFRIQFANPDKALAHTEYLLRRVKLVTLPPPLKRFMTSDAKPNNVPGIVTSFKKLSVSNDGGIYEITLESRLALLRNSRKVRFFLDKSYPEIIALVLKENGFDQLRADFEMAFHLQYQQWPITFQWKEDDLTFIQRLCRRAGIWFVCEMGELCETIIFGDDITHYLHDKEKFSLPYYEERGLLSDGEESISKLTLEAGVIIPERYTVRVRSLNNADHAIETTEQIHDDKTVYGEQYVYGLPIDTLEQAKREAVLRREAAQAGQILYRGETDRYIVPRSVVRLTNVKLEHAEYGLLIVSAKYTSLGRSLLKVEFTAIPSNSRRLYRMPLLEETWPKVEGPITGTIASPGGYSQPFITGQGQYVVELHMDRDERYRGQPSCLLRFAKPFAGAGNIGMHFGLVEGTIVSVDFFGGCPDAPYISEVHHTDRHPDLIHSHDRRMSRSEIRTRDNNSLEFEDWPNEQHIKVATEHGKSQLNLGHTVERGRKFRGAGAELRSDLQTVIRGGSGLLLTSEAQGRAIGKTNDMSGAMRVFEAARQNDEQLAHAAHVSKAEFADMARENAWLRESFEELKQQVIALSAPNGIGVATPDRIKIAAGKDISATSLRHTHFSALQNFTASAKELVSIFAYRLGIKLFAQQGPVLIQAQNDAMALTAKQDLTVTSADGTVNMRADKAVRIESGGAFIEIKDGNITLGGPKKLLFKFASMKKQGAEVQHLAGPAFTTAVVPFATKCEAWVNGSTTPAKVTPPESKFASWEMYANGAAIPAAPRKKAEPKNRPVEQESKSVEGSKTQNSTTDTSNDVAKQPEADANPSAEPSKPLAVDPKEPLKLDTKAACNWSIPSFKKTFKRSRETPEYYGYADTENSKTDKMVSGGGEVEYAVSYDDASKTITATAVIILSPVLLVEMDAKTKLPAKDAKGDYKTVLYDSYINGANSRKEFEQLGYTLIDRETKDIDVSRFKNEIETTLNGNNYQLVLDGCSKNANCGRRVSIKLVADVKVVTRADAKNMTGHKLLLYPDVKRADAANWSEIDMDTDEFGKRVPAAKMQIKAHECGHLFNLPDEYWQRGGFVHAIYVKEDKSLNFELGKTNQTKQTWKIDSSENLMGYGATRATAKIPPYYFEYIREGFSRATGIIWRVGY